MANLTKEKNPKSDLSRLRPGAVCAVGWEPNPAHTQVLVRLEEAYNKCGWKVMIMMFMLTMMFVVIVMRISSVLRRRRTSADGKSRLLAIYVERPSNQN